MSPSQRCGGLISFPLRRDERFEFVIGGRIRRKPAHQRDVAIASAPRRHRIERAAIAKIAITKSDASVAPAETHSGVTNARRKCQQRRALICRTQMRDLSLNAYVSYEAMFGWPTAFVGMVLDVIGIAALPLVLCTFVLSYVHPPNADRAKTRWVGVGLVIGYV